MNELSKVLPQPIQKEQVLSYRLYTYPKTSSASLFPAPSITNLNSFKTTYSFYKSAGSTPGCQTCLPLHLALLLAVSTAYLKTRCFSQLAYGSICPFFQKNFLLQRFCSTHPFVGNQSQENLVLNRSFKSNS